MVYFPWLNTGQKYPHSVSILPWSWFSFTQLMPLQFLFFLNCQPRIPTPVLNNSGLFYFPKWLQKHSHVNMFPEPCHCLIKRENLFFEPLSKKGICGCFTQQSKKELILWFLRLGHKTVTYFQPYSKRILALRTQEPCCGEAQTVTWKPIRRGSKA